MTYKCSRIVTRGILGLVFVCGFFVSPTRAQKTGTESFSLSDDSAGPLDQLRKRLAQSSLSTTSLPLEGAVDPDSYVVGPGDLFSVSISLLESAATPVPVSADGKLLLPDGVPIQIAGLTLRIARNNILQQLNKSFENANVDVVLAGARQFYVHVSGAVPRPGRYLALPVERVSGILELALADTTRAPVSNPDFLPSLRNISVVHRDGSEDLADLLGYFASGDTQNNPYLQDGDVLFVPAYDPTVSSIYIGGAVPFPGAYDYRPGDTLLGLIQLAGGISDTAAVGEIVVVRTSADGSPETMHFESNAVLSGDSQGFVLKVRDHVSVSESRERRGSVAVSGRVYRPGIYPIVDGATTLGQLLELAGGLKDDALVRGVYLERRSLPGEGDAERSGGGVGIEAIQQLLAADTTAIMQKVRLADIDYLSRSYFAQELRLQNRVSITLTEEGEIQAENMTLRDGDRLVVPRDDRTVYVFGQVQRPGFLQLLPEGTADDYVEAAGGLGEAASLVYLVKAGDNRFTAADSEIVESGDMIFVDRQLNITDDVISQRLLMDQERLDLEIRRQKSDSSFRILQTILQTAATAASVVALIITARR
jgi:polysaccharide biosynthesis/export protein